MLAIPSNVASDVVFTSKKIGVSVDDRAAKQFHVFHLFAHFFISVNVVEFFVLRLFFPKGVQLQLDGWPWNGEGVWGAKGCVGAQCLGGSNQDKVECELFEETMKIMLGQDWFLLVVC